MRTNDLYDADSIAARYTVQDLLVVAAREQMLHEAGRIHSRRTPIAEVGHLLVRVGQWLQTIAQQPAYQEETV